MVLSVVPRVCAGPGCVNVLPDTKPSGGRRRVYCSQACREKAYRQRQTTPAANDPEAGAEGLGIDKAHKFTSLAPDGSSGGNLIRPGYVLGTPHKPFRLDADMDDPEGAVGATASEADTAPLSDRLLDAGLSLTDFLDAGYEVVLRRVFPAAVVRSERSAPYTLAGHEYRLGGRS
jgi:hypothetical protein